MTILFAITALASLGTILCIGIAMVNLWRADRNLKQAAHYLELARQYRTGERHWSEPVE